MKKLIAAIVYTHLWIAICAAAMVLQTSFLLTGSWALTPLTYLTFGSTLFIYALHRLVGLQKLKDLNISLNPRYIIINRDQRIVLFFGILGGLITAYFFFQLQHATQLWLVLPGMISIAYVIPFFSGKRRLRDIGVIKIFLIAIAYAIISVILVYVENEAPIGRQAVYLFFEKALFIFAITLPFDMRDLKIDKVSEVKTLPMIMGWEKAKIIGSTFLMLCILLVWINGLYAPNAIAIGMSLAYVLSSIYLSRISQSKDDLYYSFGMDGMMILQTLLLFVVSLT